MGNLNHKILVLFWIVYMWMHHLDWQMFYALRRLHDAWEARLMNHFDLWQWEEQHDIDYEDYLRIIP